MRPQAPTLIAHPCDEDVAQRVSIAEEAPRRNKCRVTFCKSGGRRLAIRRLSLWQDVVSGAAHRRRRLGRVPVAGPGRNPCAGPRHAAAAIRIGRRDPGNCRLHGDAASPAPPPAGARQSPVVEAARRGIARPFVREDAHSPRPRHLQYQSILSKPARMPVEMDGFGGPGCSVARHSRNTLTSISPVECKQCLQARPEARRAEGKCSLCYTRVTGFAGVCPIAQYGQDEWVIDGILMASRRMARRYASRGEEGHDRFSVS